MSRRAENAWEEDIHRYINTGERDLCFYNWPGQNLIDKAKNADPVLKKALLAEVERRAEGKTPPGIPRKFKTKTFAIAKLEPMINGLFPIRERQTVLDLLAPGITFLTPSTFRHIILASETWLSTAWSLANLYLTSVGVPPLDPDFAPIVGMSEETTCYVSTAYFTEDDPFADFVIHEAAHVFHNWKREYVGLPFTRAREWLLPIEFEKRETFAYACEAYSRILELAERRNERRQRLRQYAVDHIPSAVEKPKELVRMLEEAVEARNGWKKILTRCSNLKRP